MNTAPGHLSSSFIIVFTSLLLYRKTFEVLHNMFVLTVTEGLSPLDSRAGRELNYMNLFFSSTSSVFKVSEKLFLVVLTICSII